jgi:hypothetical protein
MSGSDESVPRHSNGDLSVFRADKLNRNFLIHRRQFVAAICFVALSIGFSATQAKAQSEDQIKAAFLFNFARYVEWPSAAFENGDAAVKICMVGSGDFAGVVSQTVSGKNVGDRAVEVDTPSDLSRASGCHILYVGASVSEGPAEVAASVHASNVFTVADRAGFASGGGIANFIRTDNKVRFEINPGAAKKAGLKISSRLLRLAKVVK